MSDLNKLKELRNALACWQGYYDATDDKEQYDMFGAAVDGIERLQVAEAEIAKRDNAAGKPVATLRVRNEDNSLYGIDWNQLGDADGDWKLYLAQPAALPPEMISQAELVSFVLREIGSLDASEIDSDTIDLRFEVDGFDTGSDVSITEYATKGADIIRLLTLDAAGVKWKEAE